MAPHCSRRRAVVPFIPFILQLLLIHEVRCFSTPSAHQGGSLPTLPNIRAAVIVPGFLTGKDDFVPLATSLNNIGIPTVVVPMPRWHWLPCLGGRSMRPMLERIDFTVRHLAGVAANLGDFERTTAEGLAKSVEDAAMAEYGMGPPELFQTQGVGRGGDDNNKSKRSDPQLLIPKISYNLNDVYRDFRNNPGGVLEVGGSAEVEQYPLWNPLGSFPAAPEPMGKVALIESFSTLFKKNLITEITALGNGHIKRSTLIYAFMEKHGIDEDHWDTVAQIHNRVTTKYFRKNNIKISGKTS